MPYGQIPLLEVDGQQLAQSGAILRFLAKRFNLDGKCDWEAAKAEEIWFFFYDNFREQHPYNAARLGHGAKGADLVCFTFVLPERCVRLIF
jgi:glutathione S-transferase